MSGSGAEALRQSCTLKLSLTQGLGARSFTWLALFPAMFGLKYF